MILPSSFTCFFSKRKDRNTSIKKHVFKKYYRVHDGDKHNVSGYGLGLSYVREVKKVLNGRIRVESKLGYGTTVIIRIPLNHEKS